MTLLILRAVLLACLCSLRLVAADSSDSSARWSSASAETDGATTTLAADVGSQCGYGNRLTDGFGQARVSVSGDLFKKGALCGACFEIKCNSKKHHKCLKGKTLRATVTDRCSWSPVRGPRSTCSGKSKSLVLPLPLLSKLSTEVASGPLPVVFRRVNCKRRGSAVFQINGSPAALQVNIRNVKGSGTVTKAWIKSKRSKSWVAMKNIWGENWQAEGDFRGLALSFKIKTSGKKGEVFQYSKAVPKAWQFGGTYSSGKIHTILAS